MNDDAVKLLMMFINDAYNGKCPTKKTAISMMHFVAKHKQLQRLVNSSDSDAILSYKFEDNIKLNKSQKCQQAGYKVEE